MPICCRRGVKEVPFLENKCPHCGQPLPKSSAFCLHCMQGLHDKDVPTASDNKRKKGAVILCLLLLLSGRTTPAPLPLPKRRRRQAPLSHRSLPPPQHNPPVQMCKPLPKSKPRKKPPTRQRRRLPPHRKTPHKLLRRQPKHRKPPQAIRLLSAAVCLVTIPTRAATALTRFPTGLQALPTTLFMATRICAV